MLFLNGTFGADFKFLLCFEFLICFKKSEKCQQLVQCQLPVRLPHFAIVCLKISSRFSMRGDGHLFRKVEIPAVGTTLIVLQGCITFYPHKVFLNTKFSVLSAFLIDFQDRQSYNSFVCFLFFFLFLCMSTHTYKTGDRFLKTFF